MILFFRETLTFAALLLVSGSVLAQNAPPRPENRELRESVRRVEQETGGSVLRAERVHGRQVNRMKVLTPEGRVRVVHENHERPERASEAVDRNPRRNARERDDRRY